MVCTANNVATAARRAVSAAHAPAAAGRSADRALSSGCNPASEATTPTASSRRSSAAGGACPGRRWPPSRRTDGQSGAHALRRGRSQHPQRRTTSCVSGYPQALSPRTIDPIARFTVSPPSGTPVTSTLSPKLPGTQSPRSCRQRPGTTNYRPADAGNTGMSNVIDIAGPRIVRRAQGGHRMRSVAGQLWYGSGRSTVTVSCSRPSGSMSSCFAGVPMVSVSDTIPHRLAPNTGCTWSGRTAHVVGTHR